MSHGGPRPMSGTPSVGVFLRDPSPYLREFWRNPRKTPNGLVNKRVRGLNLAPSVYQFERRTTQPLVGPLRWQKIMRQAPISIKIKTRNTCLFSKYECNFQNRGHLYALKITPTLIFWVKKPSFDTILEWMDASRKNL